MLQSHWSPDTKLIVCLQVNGKTIFSLATCIVVDFPFKFLIVVESYKFGSYQLNKILVMT